MLGQAFRRGPGNQMQVFPVSQTTAHVVPVFHLGLKVAGQAPGKATRHVLRAGGWNRQSRVSHVATIAGTLVIGKRAIPTGWQDRVLALLNFPPTPQTKPQTTKKKGKYEQQIR